MRRSLLHVAVLLALAGAPLVIGCGAAARPLAPASSASSARVEGPSVRERELEGRLALAEAEVLELRDRQRLADAESRRRTVRIGRARTGLAEEATGAPSADVVLPEEDGGAATPTEGPRPVLELVGQPQVRAVTLPAAEPLALPPPPPGVEDRLPILPIEGADAPGRYARQLAARVAATPSSRLPAVPVEGLPAGAPTAPASARTEDVAVAEYREALELVHARQLERALAALSVFIARHPGHSHAHGARYWRAEVRYAQREYALALAGFEELLRLSPAHARAADALLKIGLCHQRMGDLARAHLVFQRVQRQFPDTAAARSASRQDAS